MPRPPADRVRRDEALRDHHGEGRALRPRQADDPARREGTARRPAALGELRAEDGARALRDPSGRGPLRADPAQPRGGRPGQGAEVQRDLPRLGGRDQRAPRRRRGDRRGAEERRGHGRPLLAALVFAGLRIDEALSLLWRDVDLAGGYLRVRRSKTEAGVREVDLLAPLREELADLKARRDPGAGRGSSRLGRAGRRARATSATGSSVRRRSASTRRGRRRARSRSPT